MTLAKIERLIYIATLPRWSPCLLLLRRCPTDLLCQRCPTPGGKTSGSTFALGLLDPSRGIQKHLYSRSTQILEAPRVQKHPKHLEASFTLMLPGYPGWGSSRPKSLPWWMDKNANLSQPKLQKANYKNVKGAKLDLLSIRTLPTQGASTRST